MGKETKPRRGGMFIATADRKDEAPQGRNVNITLLTELGSSLASLTINIALLTELTRTTGHWPLTTVITNQSIICFAGEDWWYHHPHSKNHIMRRLARAGNRVMFINSISMGLPSAKSPDFYGKIKRKLKSYARAVRRTEEGILVVSPPVLPFYSNAFGRAVNQGLLRAEIKSLMRLYGFRNPLLWIAIPTARDIIGHLGERALIYQVSDKYAANQMDHATGSRIIADMHSELLERADLIYYSGRKLIEEETAAHPEIKAKAK